MSQLPPGFVLDEDIPVLPQTSLPAGFVEDSPGDNALDFLGEVSAAGVRGFAQTADFLTSPLQALDNATGDRLPTFEQLHASTPGGEGNFMEPGLVRDATRAGGEVFGPGSIGTAPVVGRNLTKVADAALDFAGIGQSTPAVVLGQTAQDMMDNKGLASAATKKFEVDPVTNPMEFNPRRLVDDPAGIEGVRQGIEPKVVSLIKSSAPETKRGYREMMNIFENRKVDARDLRRGIDVVGDSLSKRIEIIKAANQQAGRQIDDVARSISLDGVDFQAPVAKFQKDMADMGIHYDPNTHKVSFRNSDIQGLKGLEGTVSNVLDQMWNMDLGSAYDIHRIKRIIDENIAYGKVERGLGGKTERLLLDLRQGLNRSLQDASPEYAQVNKTYSDTIQALEEMQSLAGKKTDIYGDNASRNIGILSRRILSNAVSGGRATMVTKELDDVAKRYASDGSRQVVPYRGASNGEMSALSTPLDDSPIDLLLFEDMMERAFGSQAAKSFQGQQENVADKLFTAVEATRGSTMDSAVNLGKLGLDKARGVDEEAMIKAIYELLGGNQ